MKYFIPIFFFLFFSFFSGSQNATCHRLDQFLSAVHKDVLDHRQRHGMPLSLHDQMLAAREGTSTGVGGGGGGEGVPEIVIEEVPETAEQ